jgi:hypothetical protein
MEHDFPISDDSSWTLETAEPLLSFRLWPLVATGDELFLPTQYRFLTA